MHMNEAGSITCNTDQSHAVCLIRDQMKSWIPVRKSSLQQKVKLIKADDTEYVHTPLKPRTKPVLTKTVKLYML